MPAMPLTLGTLHFVGIGGIGMSGIAEILRAKGYEVQGSDIAESANIERLRAQGITVNIGHKAENLTDKNGEAVAVMVVSTAIQKDNPELLAARKLKIPVIKRAEMLAELMRTKNAIAIAGTHGKTTTTSIVASILEEGQFDPTVINGGIVNTYGTNTRHGDGEWLVAEADESDGSFLHLPATAAVVTNIDPEHLDHYGDFEAIKAAFREFLCNIPFYGFAAVCGDHATVQSMLPDLQDRKIFTYGFNAQNDVRAHNLRFSPEGCTFDVSVNPRLYGEIAVKGDAPSPHLMREMFLPMPGEHNVLNALSAIIIGIQMGMNDVQIKDGLNKFGGVKRRFTKTGEVNGCTIIDDYGHHPVEIKAVLKAARKAVGDEARIFAVVQPHRYTRLQSLFEDFSTCMHDADDVLVLDVHEAGEQPIEGVNGASLAGSLTSHGHGAAQYVSNPDQLADLIAPQIKQGDMVICLGAGSITKYAYALPEQLETALKQNEKERSNVA
jgi:UDP-N-acetylmuramate--alanine ligase